MKISKAVNKIKKSALLKNISTYTLGNIIQKSAEFLLLPLWSRFLTPTDYGITGILLSYIGVLLPIFTVSLQSYLSYIYYKYKYDDEDKLNRYIYSVYLFQIIASLTASLVLILFGNKLWPLITKSDIDFNPFGIMMVLIAFFESINAIPMALYQVQQKAKKYITLQLLTFSLNVLFTLILVVFLKRGAYGKMLATLLTYSSIGIYNSLFTVRKYFIRKIDFQQIKKSLSYSIPIIPHTLSSWALNAADKVILEKFVDLDQLGLYNFGYSLGLAMNVIVNAINLAWMPHYFEVMNHNKNRQSIIKKELTFYLIAIGSLCFLGILFNYEFIYLALPKNYLGSAIYVPAILLGYFFVGLYKFGAAPLFFYKKTKIIPIVSGLSAILNIVLNILLIPTYGPIASAWITTFAYFLLFVLSFVFSQKYDKTDYPFNKYAIYIAFITFISIIINQLNNFSILPLLEKLGILVIYLLVVKELFYKEIKDFVS